VFFECAANKLSNYPSLLRTPSRGMTICVCNMYEASNLRSGERGGEVLASVWCSKTSFFAYTSVYSVVGGVYFPRASYEYWMTWCMFETGHSIVTIILLDHEPVVSCSWHLQCIAAHEIVTTKSEYTNILPQYDVIISKRLKEIHNRKHPIDVTHKGYK